MAADFQSGFSSLFASAPVTISGNGTAVLVPGSPSQSVRVYRLLLIASVACTITLQDGSAPAVALTGPLSLGASTPLILPFDTQPWFATSLGNAFTALIAGLTAGTIGGVVFYQRG